MTLVLLIAGLILDFAGSHWFPGAGTVGVILTIVGSIGVVIQLVAVAIAARIITRR